MEDTDEKIIGYYDIHLTSNAFVVDKPTELEKHDIQNLKDIQALIGGMSVSVGNQVAKPILVDAKIRVPIIANPNGLCGVENNLANDIARTADQLKRNASCATPNALAVAVTASTLVPLMRAISTSNIGKNLKVCLEIGEKYEVLPVLQPSDFTEPAPKDNSQKYGTYEIRGIMRDDEKGHVLIVTKDEIHIRLTKNRAEWEWESVKNFLDDKCMIQCNIKRSDNNRDWEISGDNEITRQSRLNFAKK